MDTKEQEVHAQQHKAKVDLTIQHARAWEKFQARKKGYAQKYGSTYADILLREEKETLEAGFNQDYMELSEQHDQQWLSYHENLSSPEQPSPVLAGTEPAIDLAENKMKNIDEKTSQSLGDPAHRTLFSNPFKQVELEQKQEPTPKTKDIDQSQNYMTAMLSAQKANPTKAKEVENDKMPVSMSARFSQGLSYTQAERADQTGRSPERTKDMDRD